MATIEEIREALDAIDDVIGDAVDGDETRASTAQIHLGIRESAIDERETKREVTDRDDDKEDVPNRKKAPDGMYTAREAMERTGLAQSSFYNQVRAGSIPSVRLPGRKEAFYPRAEIDTYAARVEEAVEGIRPSQERVHRPTRREQEEARIQERFGDDFVALRRLNRSIVAMIQLWEAEEPDRELLIMGFAVQTMKYGDIRVQIQRED